MHILLIADGRSPHTVGWTRGMARLGIATTLLSSRRIRPSGRAALEEIVGAGRVHEPHDLWSRARPHLLFASPNRKQRSKVPSGRAPDGASIGQQSRGMRTLTRLEVHAASRLWSQLESLITNVQPDALHALRIQFEAVAATRVDAALPMAVSTWGQDLVSTAPSSGLLEGYTRSALRRADLLMSDCQRDADLAVAWGLAANRPTYVIPGNFGVDLDRLPQSTSRIRRYTGGAGGPIVVYPRGVREFVNYRGFVEAATVLLAKGTAATFVGVGLNNASQSQGSVPQGLVYTTDLDHEAMFELAIHAAVIVSPAWSDGTPNSILEGMAGGAIPVCGDLDSLRELEKHGAVMTWCDPSSTESIAAAMEEAIRLSRDPANASCNRAVIADQYSVSTSLGRARSAYQRLANLR